jgi:hypothetical protein
MPDYREKLLTEIANTCAFRLGNIERGTASRMDREIVAECQGYISLLNYSVLTAKEVYEFWKNTNLGFM